MALVIFGYSVTGLYLVLQSLMYVTSFSSIQCRVSLKDTLQLFLKRNLISVFLPAGGVSSLAFFTGPLEKKGISKTQIHYASTLYGFIGILSVILVAVPAFIYALLKGNSGTSEWLALAALVDDDRIVAVSVPAAAAKRTILPMGIDSFSVS